MLQLKLGHRLVLRCAVPRHTYLGTCKHSLNLSKSYNLICFAGRRSSYLTCAATNPNSYIYSGNGR